MKFWLLLGLISTSAFAQESVESVCASHFKKEADVQTCTRTSSGDLDVIRTCVATFYIETYQQLDCIEGAETLEPIYKCVSWHGVSEKALFCIKNY